MPTNAIVFIVFLSIAIGLFVLFRKLFGTRSDEPLSGQPSAARSFFVDLFSSVVPQRAAEVQDIKQDLVRAGDYRPDALKQYLAFRNGAVVLIVILTLCVFWAETGNSETQSTLLAVGLVISGLVYGMPRMILRSLAKSRVHRIQIGLPDALDVMSMSVSAGLPLRESLKDVGKEIRLSYPDLATEFEIVQRQADAGSLGQAFRKFSERTDANDIKTLAAMIAQTERLGTHVDQTIKDYAMHIRRSSRQRAEEHANKVSVKMIFPILFCLMPPVMILLLGGPVLQLRDYMTGRDSQFRELIEQANSGSDVQRGGVILSSSTGGRQAP